MRNMCTWFAAVAGNVCRTVRRAGAGGRAPLPAIVMLPVAGISMLAVPIGERPVTSATPVVAAAAPASTPGTTELAAVNVAGPAEGSSAQAPRAGRAAMEELVVLGDLPRLFISSMGGATYLPPAPADGAGGNGDGGTGGDGGGGTRGCDAVSSHTDADFGGGSFVVQAGFAESEIAAAQYTIPATSFPIKILTTEVIVAQIAAIVPTTTKWTMLFWSGRPDTGTLVASYSSDGDILPHITLPPGTNGVNVLFGIDPSDPDQIIINAPADGSHTFTIGFRIDDHNAQTGTGCNSGDIPTNRNAFPTTDVSGLSQPTGNWLKGINCGAFGCPPNGGWSRFSSLPSFCRPSGDWVMRASWTAVNCQPGVGACCLPSGQCQVITEASCLSQAGTYKGDGTSCGPDTCPAPTGACCFPNNFCLTLKEVDCAGAGGSWLGANTTCNNGQCPSGACCLPLGNCITTTQGSCAAQGGVFQGVGTSCATANCPQPTGACCLSNGFCLQLTQTDCNGIPGSSFKGPLTTCVDGNGNGQADICESQCPADFDHSGFVDIEDYTAYVGAFEAGTPDADFDGSGFVDIEDFTGFVFAFEAGC